MPLMQLFQKTQHPHGMDDTQETDFTILKNLLTTAPVLTYPNFQRDFYLYTDASGVGLGMALMQLDERQ